MIETLKKNDHDHSEIPDPNLDKHTGKSKKIIRKMGAIILALTSLGTVVLGVGGKVAVGDPLAAPKVVATSLDTCDHLNTETSDQINALIAEAQDPTRPNNPNEDLNEKAKIKGEDYWDTNFDDMKIQTAEKNGLHLVDVREFIDRIDKSESSVEAILIANEYLHSRGLDIGFIKDNSSRNPSDLEKIDHNEIKNQLQYLLYDLAYMPQEVLEVTNIKQIYIVEDLEMLGYIGGSISKVRPGGLAYPEGQTIFLTKSSAVSHSALSHELGHAFDNAICGSLDMFKDKEFAELNPQAYVYEGFKEDSYDSVSDSGPWYQDSRESVFSEEYSTSNIQEDKATIYQMLINGLDQETLLRNDAVGKKYRYLLGRIEQKVPGFTQYLIDSDYDRHANDFFSEQ